MQPPHPLTRGQLAVAVGGGRKHARALAFVACRLQQREAVACNCDGQETLNPQDVAAVAFAEALQMCQCDA